MVSAAVIPSLRAQQSGRPSLRAQRGNPGVMDCRAALAMTGNVLLLPGWQNSGPTHWQSLWEAAHGFTRVQQHDWERPLRGDWLMQLEEAVLACSEAAVLVAHSLGCIQVAAWATHTQNAARVKAVLLVAPGDVEQEAMRPLLPSWSPIIRQKLPFKSVLVASRDDPYCAWARAQGLARDWGATLVDIGPAGHINADAGLGDWPQGLALLQALCREQDDALHRSAEPTKLRL